MSRSNDVRIIKLFFKMYSEGNLLLKVQLDFT
jgi:hypothetical protein